MPSLPEAMQEFKAQLQRGVVQQAYRGLMDYLMTLKTYLKTRYPDYFVSGGLYQGYMDMAYFSFHPEAFKRRGLKIAVVFNFDTFAFEVWLGGYNKQVQAQYWALFQQSGWNQYPLVPSLKGEDAIVTHTLVETPDFNDLDALTQRIEAGTLTFIGEIEAFLSAQNDLPRG
ncbi:hypothetical protein ADN00_09675 [Ornatilinea apprima]|uniref:DUF7000 domain-containing protein n=1 Tax=Ornatilinea apprima TaxID=1134406 RepID=A0A0P6X2K2_9CHLR|nr:hypothetical protein [Ornatilinea apprima]KPL76863.1 hypothetical protein ADN00_09675 [Ornatilinea apprima]